MNFLAHIYLSQSIDAFMLGNFMADSIKGNQYLQYPSPIKEGILMHRFIDAYTDSHPKVLENIQLLRPQYGKYASIVSDIVYDHFLAKNFEFYANVSLQVFVNEVYRFMEMNDKDATPFIQEVIPIMQKYNWLENYQYKEGLQKIFCQFGRRIKVDTMFDNVTEVVWTDYEIFEENFTSFFPEIKMACESKKSELFTL